MCMCMCIINPAIKITDIHKGRCVLLRAYKTGHYARVCTVMKMAAHTPVVCHVPCARRYFAGAYGNGGEGTMKVAVKVVMKVAAPWRW